MQPSPDNDTLMRIVGMSRSGNHAIIEWILSGLSGRWCFLNCVEPKQDPWRSARPMDDGQRYRTSCPARPQPSPPRQSGWDHLVLSHEDTFLKPVFGEPGASLQAMAIGGSRRRIDVLILRDPFNLFASRWRGRMGWVDDHIAIRVWKQHARAFLARRSAPRRPLVPISYNAWVAQPHYRREIARLLRIDPSSDIPPRIARCGGGSSFDGYGEVGAATRLQVFDRWRHYAGESAFRRLFDDETRQLSGRIFGERLSEPKTSTPEAVPSLAPLPAL